MNWEQIKQDYLNRQDELKKDGIRDEIAEYESIIDGLKESDVDDILETGALPERLLSLIDENYQTGVFKSKKYGVQIGTIYDIIDKDFTPDESDDEQE